MHSVTNPRVRPIWTPADSVRTWISWPRLDSSVKSADIGKKWPSAGEVYAKIVATLPPWCSGSSSHVIDYASFMGRFTLRFVNFAWRLTGRSDEMRLIDAALCDPDSVNGKRKLTSLGSLVVGRDVGTRPRSRLLMQ